MKKAYNSKEINQHGLARYIPAHIAREVRKSCGFGCVLCGCPIYHYDHFEVHFKDAREHDPDKIALLCPNHHDDKTDNRLSDKMVKKYRKNPFALRNGITTSTLLHHFDSNEQLKIHLGKNVFIGINTVIRKSNSDWFKISPPLDEDEPYRLNVRFFDDGLLPALEIIDNMWRCRSDLYDLEYRKSKLTLRKDRGQILLELETKNPNEFFITRLRMLYDNTGVIVDKNGNIMIIEDGCYTHFSDCQVTNSDTIIKL